MNRNFFAALTVVVCTVLVSAGCSPWSKQEYLVKYEAFIEDVAENSKNYYDEQWFDRQAQFEKLSGEWYRKYEPELSTKEQVIVAGYKVKYLYYRSLHDAAGAIDGLLESLNVDDLEKQIRYYVEHDMEDDLEELYEKAVRAGKKTEATVRKIYDDLDVESKNWNH